MDDLNMDYNNSPGIGWTWYSICSKHMMDNDINCPMCMAGYWVNDEEQAKDHELYVNNYDEWHKKHNAPDSESRRALEKLFPKLKFPETS